MLKVKRKKIPIKPRFTYCHSTAKRFLVENTNFTNLPIDPFQIYQDHGWLILSWSEAKDVLKINDPLKLKETDAEARTSIIRDTNTYLTVYDDAIIPESRIRWTVAHEIGHIVLNHLIEFDKTALNRGGLSKDEYAVLEVEANNFAAEILTPFAVLRETGVIKADEIMEVCDISHIASEYRENTLKKAKSQYNEFDKKVLIKFKKFIKKLLYSKVCLDCNNVFSKKNSSYCPICGSTNLIGKHFKEDKKLRYNKIELDENYRAIQCPTCSNEEILGDYCHICGTYLTNRCTGFSYIFSNEHYQGPWHIDFATSCGQYLDGDARFCTSCGSTSIFFESGLLKDWKEEQQEQAEKTEYNLEKIDLPF